MSSNRSKLSNQKPTAPEPLDQELRAVRRIKRRPWLDKFDGCMMGCIGSWLCAIGIMGGMMIDWDHEPSAYPTDSILIGIGLLMSIAGITIFRIKSK